MQEVQITPGHLPHERGQIDAWLETVQADVLAQPLTAPRYGRAVRELAELLSQDSILRMYVCQMLEQVPAERRPASSVLELLAALQLISTRAPTFSADPLKANFFPMSTLFVHMMMTAAGQVVFRHEQFNNCLREILREWCRLLDSPASCDVLHEGPTGWLSPASYALHQLDDYVIPDRSASAWGFASFNAFFHRRVRPGCRPVAAPEDPSVITAPNDGTLYKVARDVRSLDTFWIKSQPYSLKTMLHGHRSAERFYGGTVFQSFLDGRNYHRYHAPVSGTVRDLHVIEGLMFSNAESAGFDATAGTYSQAYMTCVNTRGIVFIESDDPAIGTVCFMAIGVSEVSSVRFTVRAGQRVQKGDELGYFSYGGSSTCLLFRPDVIEDFTIDVHDTGTEVGTRGARLVCGQQIARARSSRPGPESHREA